MSYDPSACDLNAHDRDVGSEVNLNLMRNFVYSFKNKNIFVRAIIAAASVILLLIRMEVRPL